MLEAWAFGKPTLAPEECPEKRGHTARSGAGALFGSETSFPQALSELLSDADRRARSIETGTAYVRESYAWPKVTERFMQLARYVSKG